MAYRGYKGYGTPESIAREREIAEALMGGLGRAPRNIGEGLNAIGQALMVRGKRKRADKAEEAGLERRSGNSEQIMAALFGQGGRPPQAAPVAPQAAPLSGSSRPAPGGVSPDVVQALIRQESGGNPNAVSPKGAQGLMQVMPETARDPGFGVRPLENPMDPEENQRFGTDYLNAMVERYEGDLPRALVAYNWGPGKADQWDGSIDSLPAETQGYVKNIMGELKGGQQVAQMGGGAPPAPQQAGPDPAEMQALMQLYNDPWTSEADKKLIGTYLEQQLQGPKPTSAIREFEYAQDNPAFNEFLQGRRPQTNVNVDTGSNMPQVGTIPQGYELQQTETGWQMAPIPGGPAELEQQEAEAQRQGQEELKGRYAGIVLEDIGRVRQKVESSALPVTGPGGGLLKHIPGTNAYDASALIDTIKANVGFDRLQQMREASPTGGALGQVSEMENRLLQATLGNLELSQTEAQFLGNLDRLEQVYLDIIHGPGNRPDMGGGDDAPEGVDPGLWQHMTPEERALWQN